MEVILYVFGTWAVCSLIMMFFLPWIEKKFEPSREDSYYLVAFAPFTILVIFGIALFLSVYKLGEKVFS